MDVLETIEAEQMKENAENFNVGDTVKVHFKIVEGQTERIQVFQGIVLAKSGTGISRTFTVRKISYGIGVERIFPLHSPRIEKVEVARRGRVRRAKLYYLRKRVGKAAKVSELVKKRENRKKAQA
jgi:large subunit ribosomal protein L19